ncbi:Bro-N domain-containing protein [Micrococcus luteus]|uniref:BRO-N domain-containing protein n=1 Tax=Micrococcus luteus TaxID=1270 RepID=UPI0015D83CDF|nr:BRO family protein [Micrococcus luteus]
MNAVQPFDYQGHQVRTLLIDGEPHFVANDICAVLDLTDPRKSVNLLDEDERNTVPVTDSLGREQMTFVVTEAGMYSLVLRSRKPEANPRTTLALLDDDEKGPRSVRTPGGQGRPHGREDR